jgi:DGQHR domain-containing protein
MRLFPGVKAEMGRWHYYVVKMTMEDLASTVRFAADGFEGSALGEQLQRSLNEGRARKQIVRYLEKQPDRFFNSIVIAAIGGEPRWMAISMADDPRFELLAADPVLNDSFGVLMFTGQEKYYALDGQHRLKAIKALVDTSDDEHINAPEGFSQEEISVVLVVPGDAETPEEFRKRFRRLFGNLNRYAKPMDNATSIIMDEDDAFAIVTRRLFVDHPFFKTVGPDRESKVVFTEAGTSMKPNMSHLFMLEILYECNISLLSSASRKNIGYDGEGETKIDDFKRFRPEDELLDSFYLELSNIWDAIFEVLPVLKSDPTKMRNHHVADFDELDELADERDVLWFWPIGQRELARLVRYLIDENDADVTDPASLRRALSPLRKVPSDLNSPPWRDFILVNPSGEPGKWRMRNENRKEVMNISMALIIASLNKDAQSLEGIEANYKQYLLPGKTEDEANEAWQAALASFD